jgi:PAS domain S-box-containing protein
MVWDDQMIKLYGVSRDETPNNLDAWLNRLHPADKEAAIAACQASLGGEKEFDTEFRVFHPDGTVKHLKANGLVIIGADGKPDRMLGINMDITEEKQAEKEKIKLEHQLQQSQKIESIGQLAGGVAHDFNNMLGVILGHTELALMKAAPENPVIKDLEAIRSAAKRSGDLTRQLLTFARKETVIPKVIDLNDTVAGMLKMLQRLIGENIHLSWHPEVSLWAVKIDPSQLDQIFTNLCVNARDAITGIGKITIEAQNSSITENDRHVHPEAQLGDYVRLSITDTGHGIEKENLDHIFEPFFTTKEFGRGTGLGLSTVYGAVKQNHGFIDVVSERGQGTTFHVYLPRMHARIDSEEETVDNPLSQGTETILLVEDDQMLLSLTKTMLEQSGYRVLDALTIDRAISLAKKHPDPIHLLLSDLIMPVMNGKDLWDILHAIRPEMKVIFMSGYTADIIAKQGALEGGIHFLEKPVSVETLTSIVRKVLDHK